MQPYSKISFSSLYCQVQSFNVPLSSRAVMYQLLRRFLFLFPAEGVHYFAMNSFRLASRLGLKKMLRSGFSSPGNLSTEAFGLRFRNPVGLGAGFDKNARYLEELDTLGFGYVE